jgi:secreted trypsin-like serine protease
VALRDDAGRLVCSGVVVAPRAILTAAHCLPLPDDSTSPGPADVCFGPRIDACSKTIAVTGWELHPDWEPITFRADLAIVALAEDAPVPSLAIEPRFVTAGDDLEIVGYGRTDARSPASSGEKRVTITRVTAIEQGRAVHGEAACNGDSGGPLFARGRVAAITSSGPPGCVDLGRATILAPHAGWIDHASTPKSPGCSASPRTSAAPFAVVFAALAIGATRRLRSAPCFRPDRARRPSGRPSGISGHRSNTGASSKRNTATPSACAR